jgi:CRP-like cAMP-binding protein
LSLACFYTQNIGYSKGKVGCFYNKKGEKMKHEALLAILRKSGLFDGCRDNEIDHLSICLNVKRKKVAKNAFVFMKGDKFRSVGIVLSGSLHIIDDDYWGNRSITAHLAQGDSFATAFVCADLKTMPVSLMACEDAEIMLFDLDKMITLCEKPCSFHTQVIKNFLFIMAKKNVILLKKIRYVTQRTTREKLLSYLSDMAFANQGHSLPKNVNSSFEIPFNRNELADYLAVERSAMSAMLCRMRDEGIISFQKNRFTLYKPQ